MTKYRQNSKGKAERKKLQGGHRILNLTFMSGGERVIQDLTYKGIREEEEGKRGRANWFPAAGSDEEKQHVWVCAWEGDSHRGDNRLLRLAEHMVMQVIWG